MPSNRSEVTISNQALTRLGQKRIMSFQDNNNRALLMAENYAPLRDSVLEERMWSFALVRAVSESSELDEWGVKYKHKIPLDWANVWRAFRTAEGGRIDDWAVESGFVMTKEPKVYLWGSREITDPGKFSELFAQALSARIAAEVCIALTENRTLQSDMWSLYHERMTIAATRDGQQGSNERIVPGRLINVRWR